MSLHLIEARQLYIRFIDIVATIVDTQILLLQHIVSEIIGEGPDVRPVRVIGPVHHGNRQHD